MKTETDTPPSEIPEDHRLTPDDIAEWHVPSGGIEIDTPRFGREKEFFSLTGRVVLVRAEADGDLHIQLEGVDGEGEVQTVVEIPVNHDIPGAPWSQFRETVFGWTNTTFPFTTVRGRRLQLTKHPTIRVVGKAFYDSIHAGTVPNRRSSDPKLTVWEIHPVMQLEILQENN